MRPVCLPGCGPAGLMTSPCAFPAQFRQHSVGFSRVTRSLCISREVAPNNRLNALQQPHHLSSQCIPCMKTSRMCRCLWLAHPGHTSVTSLTPLLTTSRAARYSAAAGVSRWAALCLAYLLKYCTMSQLAAHTWTKSCRPVIQPSGISGAAHSLRVPAVWQEHHAHGQLPVGMSPDIHGKAFRLMIPL